MSEVSNTPSVLQRCWRCHELKEITEEGHSSWGRGWLRMCSVCMRAALDECKVDEVRAIRGL